MTTNDKQEQRRTQERLLEKMVAELELQRDLLLQVSCALKDYQSQQDLEHQGHASSLARAALAKAAQVAEPPDGD